MHVCPSCERPLIHAESSCPFCLAPQGPIRRAAISIGRGMMMVVTPIVLAACYGVPQDSDWSKADEDGDGYTFETDCDDEDAAVNPDATEVCDDAIDNNCDGLTDTEDTVGCPT